MVFIILVGVVALSLGLVTVLSYKAERSMIKRPLLSTILKQIVAH